MTSLMNPCGDPRDDIVIGKESSDWSEEIDGYIDGLSEDTVLACVDYHITLFYVYNHQK